eukprot:9555430-Ditylum_brightwellii.AAC.1
MTKRSREPGLRMLKGTGIKSGVKRVVVEKAQLDALGNDLESPDGALLTTLTEVTGKGKLEKVCMEQVSQHSHMSEKSPSMQPPLVNLLQYHGMTPFTDDVLQGVAPPVEGVSEATQLYLDQ